MAQLPQYKTPNFDFNMLGMLSQMGQLQEMDDQEKDRRALEDASRQHPDDPNALVMELNKRGRAGLALKVHQTLMDTRQKAALAQKTQLENMTSRFAQASAIASGIKDDASFLRGKELLTQFIGPDLAQHLGDRYDPAVIEQAVQWGSTEQGRLTAAKNGIDAYLEAQRLEMDGRAKAPETFQKWVEAGGNALSAARSPEEWTQIRQTFKRGGAPAAVLEMFPEDWQEDAPGLASSLAMSAKERADVANNARTAATGERNAATAETNARTSMGQLDVARGNLAVNQQNAQTREASQRAAAAKPTGTGTDQAAQTILARVKALSANINTDAGLMAKLTGGIKRAGAATNLNNDVAEYEGLIEGAIPIIARKFGHTGVLTQQDVDSVKAMFPKATDSAAIAKRKLTLIENILGGATTPAPVDDSQIQLDPNNLGRVPAGGASSNPFRRGR